MLKRRIIPCMDIQDGRTVKGINFIGLSDAGDPVELAKKYVLEGADELIFLDISATIEKRKTLSDLVKKISEEINIPFTVGGGINTVEDVSVLLNAGADKVSINSSAVSQPEIISQVARQFGSQCVVVAIDTKILEKEWMVYVNGGRVPTPLKALHWAKKAEQLGAGEILLTSINNDGSKKGFALPVIKQVSSEVNIPVIASGGAGSKEHFRDVFQQTKASGALAASIFHFGEIPIPDLKNYLKSNKIPIR